MAVRPGRTARTRSSSLILRVQDFSFLICSDMFSIFNLQHNFQFACIIFNLQVIWCDSSGPPYKPDPLHHQPHRKNLALYTKDGSTRLGRSCMYCNGKDHKSAEYKQLTDLKLQKKILSDKKLSLNCKGQRHRAHECLSKHTYQHCAGKHHNSICDR